MKQWIRNAQIVTVDATNRQLDRGDLLVVDGRIAAVEPAGALDEARRAALLGAGDVEVIEADGMVAIPGFVQTHLHLCQTLFRNLADDLVLIDWLRTRIWPMEASHSPKSLRASADLALAELIRSGTTCILDMGTVNHTDAIGEAVAASGIRGFIGKCMMDLGDEVPAGLMEDTAASLREAEALCRRWQGAGDGRIGYAFAPRFALSCTPALLEAVGALAAERGALIHTHTSETRFEIDETLRLYGKRNVQHLRDCGLTGERSVFAHGVWLDEAERDILRDTRTAIAHCPSSNLKLGSGIADIPLLQRHGVRVSLGCDGAPCNNTLDAFTEMRHAALIQKPIYGPDAMPAPTVLRLATIDGASALGLGDQIGSLEVGKRADIVLLRLDRPHNGVGGDVTSRLVYGTYPENVDTVLIDGRVVLRRGELRTIDEQETRARAGRELRSLATRAGIMA